MSKLWRSLLVATLAMLSASLAVAAQTYPSRPVTLIVTFPPGGGADIMGRVLAQKLSEKWHQPVVVENRPGAGGLLGSAIAARAKPDGYTLLLMTASVPVAVLNADKPSFDPLVDFDPITLLAKAPMLIVANNNLKANTLPELVSLAANTPGKLSYGGTAQRGVGNMVAELLKPQLGLDMQLIPYTGGGPALTALLADEVPMVILDPSGALAHIKAGDLKPIVAISRERFPLLPDVPGLGEYGINDTEVFASYGIVAPKGTPPEIIEQVSKDFNETLKLPDVVERLVTSGQLGVGSTPAQYGEFLHTEYKQFQKATALMNSAR